jgi:class 3 adenylate cyclase/tetratricopeptide (TPR) repeat protein
MAGESRRTVTVVFIDLAGSTSLGEKLDPEPLRRVMSRYFEMVSQALERHGGTVEKFIGDAVMAVFGIPTVHEDDALRATRAVVEVRDALDDLNEELEHERGVRIQIRTGVNTGEVFAGDPSAGSTLATGDAVNVAARLQQAAGPGEIFIGDTTYRLVPDAVRAEPVEKLEVKGKQDVVSSWRLVDLIEGAPAFARHFESPLIGRDDELGQLRQAFERAVRERTPYLFTVLGPAGMGKSRLAAELAAVVDKEARVLFGRCLPYGDGITFWPLAEVIREAFGDDPRDAIATFLAGDEDAEIVADRVAGAVGLAETSTTKEETFWAARRLLEALARDRPVVLVFEDVHWAEPTLLDLIEHLAEWTHDAPLFLLCLARPDLFEERPAWGGGKLNATSILLEPLSDDESEALMRSLLGKAELREALRARIAEAAEGNPLFVEQMLALVAEDGNGNGEVAVPPTIQALLAARLDRLQADERAVAERASVVGKEFWRGAVVDLSPPAARDSVGRNLQMLVRKELIRPDRSIFGGDDGFRFRHILIRDATYGGMPKELRADLHERFADWLQHKAGDRLTEYEEILGFHLEQAFHYREELGPVDETDRSLAIRAAERLGAAGRRAAERGDLSATAALLGRAFALIPAGRSGRLELVPELARALENLGKLDEAEGILREALDEASTADRRDQLRIRIEHAAFRFAQRDVVSGDAERIALEAIPELERLSDDDGLARAWRLLSLEGWIACRWSEMAEAVARALEHAKRAGNRREELENLRWLGNALYWGATPAPEGIERIQRMLEETGADVLEQAHMFVNLGGLHAMRGHFDEARELFGRGQAIYQEMGILLRLGRNSLIEANIEDWAGDPGAAERVLRRGIERLEQAGETGVRSTAASYLAEMLYRQGKEDEAEQFTRISEALSAPSDVASQVEWRQVRAKVLARRGEVGRAEELMSRAADLVEKTDFLNLRGDVLLSRAELARLTGRPEQEKSLVEEAIRTFEQKGNLAAAESSRALLSDLSG